MAMCLAYKAKVVRAEGKRLTVQKGKEKREVINAIGKVKEGSFVLVQQGMAVDLLKKA